MASYHITDDGPRACSTTPDRCPYGREGGDHFDNVAEAQVSYERIMEKEHGFEGASRARENRKSESYRLYAQMERAQRGSERFKQIATVARYSRSAPSKQPRITYGPSGRSKGYDRMKQGLPGRRVAKMANRGGRELFSRLEATPANIIRIRSSLTRRPENVPN